jgi:hypothetical protein
VSPAKVKPGSSVMVKATCAGKTVKPSSGALVGMQAVAGVAAPHASWKATVGTKTKPGGYAVGFECDGKVHKTYLTVQAAAKKVAKPKGAVRTGGGGTAVTGFDQSGGGAWGFHDPPELPRPAFVMYFLGQRQ